jgi:hypothetical protein
LRPDPVYVFVPRSFVGGGFQTIPALLDLAVPAIVIYYLWPRHRFPDVTVRSAKLAVSDAMSFLLFPLVAGLSLFAFEGPYQTFPNIAMATFLRWLQFIATYLAWNLLLDELPKTSRWQRIVIVPSLALTLGLFEDTYLHMQGGSLVLFSVGLTLGFAVLAFRRRYCASPFAATAAAAIVGAVSCLLVVMAPAESGLPPLLLLLALGVGALTIRSHRWWPRCVALASVATVGLLLSLAVPMLFPPEKRAEFLNTDPPPLHTEQIEGIAVRSDDVRVRDVAIRMAHVLAAANRVSEEVYGISPKVDELVIRGFERGGFEAEFPHRISGNFVSPRYADLCLDSSFLNDPNASIHFPDPVNAILHEYSHLYGTVPYNPWIMHGGSEEEGWATFSATRLSRRLYERFGSSLWSPAYDYAARADAITGANLAGHSVYWSHDNEYGGFRLWYQLSQRDGEAAIYRKRWNLTRRDFSWWFQISDPGAARHVASSLGFADFVAFGSDKIVRYDQVHALQDLQPLGELLGLTPENVKANYARDAGRLIDPAVRVPARGPFALDLALSLFFLALFAAIKRVTAHRGSSEVLR